MQLLRYSLRPLNWELSICGCPIFPYKCKFVNYLLKVHGLALIAIVVALLFITEVDIGSDVSSIIRFMMFIWNLSFFGYCIALNLVVWTTRDQLIILLKELSQYLTQQDHVKILGLTTKFFLHKLFCTVVVRGLIVTFTFWENFHHTKWTGFDPNQIMLIYIQMYDPIVGTLSLYLSLLCIVHLVEENIITMIQKDISNHPPSFVYHRIKQCVKFKSIVSQKVSILVCFMFGYIFVNAICNICRFQFVYSHNQTSTPRKVFVLISLSKLLIYSIQAFYLSFKTHKLSQESQEKLASLADTIVDTKKAVKWTFVLDEIRVAQEYKYRAFEMFKIDRYLLLSFISSFVPLTALFVQMINQGMQKHDS